MNRDSHYIIGKTHLVCQDYAYSGVNSKGNSVAIVSDGCSSSLNTDIGSRVLVHTALNYMQQVDDNIPYNDNLAFNIMLHAKKIIESLGLENDCLDATLFYVETFKDKVRLLTIGDGVCFFKSDGKISYTKIEYPSGAPFYASYLLDQNRKQRFNEEFTTGKKITHLSLGSKDIEIESRKNEVCSEFVIRKLVFDCDFVGVGSDGLFSFPTSIEKVIEEITSYKNYSGSFVQRRLNKFVKQCAKNNTLPNDDVSISTIYLRS